MTSSRPSAFSRYCAAVVTVALALQPLAAYAAPITGSVLAEKPLQGTNPVKPNIMYTVDDSSSMTDEYLPDFTAEAFSPFITHCRYLLVFQKFPCGLVGADGAVTRADPPIRSS